MLEFECGVSDTRAFSNKYVDPTPAFAGGSVRVWGEILMNHQTDLVILPPPGLTTVRYII